MRVWILEDVPEYETSTRYGVYTSPVVAWDDLFTAVENNVFKGSVDDFTLYVGADQSAVDQNDPKRDILVMVRYRSGDEIHLSGASVTGSHIAGAPTLSEWRDLQQVAGLLRQCAVQAGFRCSDDPVNKLSTGSWTFRREEDERY